MVTDVGGIQQAALPEAPTSADLPVDLTARHRTKIIATLGPASANAETLKALLQAGVGVIRLNFSHGEREEHLTNIALIRKIAADLQQPLAIICDLQGPKIRTGLLKDDQPVFLELNSSVIFTSKASESAPGIVATAFPELISALAPGAVILIDDGKIRLEVTETLDAETLRCRVLQGGILQARKGINVPGTVLPIAALTEKDKQDVLIALEGQVDYLAQSFIQRAQDILDLRAFVKAQNAICPPVIAKIEKPQALKDIDAILAEADGLMVARGDLGVELRPEEVPVAQKRLVRKANQAEKPVIIATQMLESMIRSVQPSRSDVSDIANAVYDGADALMLSGETAVGEHPVEAVTMMRRIIEEVEKTLIIQSDRPVEESRIVSPNFYHAIAHTAAYAARKANVKALVVLSTSGSMAQRISKLKPTRPIIALTPQHAVYNRLSLLWGVTPLVIDAFGDQTDETLEHGEQTIFSHHLLNVGDSIVFCAGNTHLKGATNMLKIYRIGELE